MNLASDLRSDGQGDLEIGRATTSGRQREHDPNPRWGAAVGPTVYRRQPPSGGLQTPFGLEEAHQIRGTFFEGHTTVGAEGPPRRYPNPHPGHRLRTSRADNARSRSARGRTRTSSDEGNLSSGIAPRANPEGRMARLRALKGFTCVPIGGSDARVRVAHHRSRERRSSHLLGCLEEARGAQVVGRGPIARRRCPARGHAGLRQLAPSSRIPLRHDSVRAGRVMCCNH